jgi:beta-glucuronidase
VARRKGLLLLAALLALVGLGSLALTLYLWFGSWPARIKAVVDFERSAAAVALHAPEPLLGHVPFRDSVSLGGTWQAVIDPHDVGFTLGVAPRDEHPDDPSDHAEFGFAGGMTLEVPGDWNSQDPRLFFYRGGVWYKRSFDQPRRNGRTFLYFGAANYRASVYLNGQQIGAHEGGFTPFNFEITDRLVDGENLLVVHVDNRRTAADVPAELTDWHNYGGITRDVLLLELPGDYIEQFHLRLAGERRDRLVGEVQLRGDARERDVTVRIPELGVSGTFTSDADGKAAIELEARPELWSPAAPKLYRVEVETDDDRVADEIGFRSIGVSGREILLNGEPVYLRGISIHEEAPGGGRAHGPRHAEVLLGWARELGANFVRLAHYPHDEHMVRLADRMGLLVWEEIPVYWSLQFASAETLRRARTQATEMVRRDRNRASVILWGIGNETPISDERQHFMRALADHVHGLDDSRPLSAALLMHVRDAARSVASNLLPALAGWSPRVWRYRIEDPLVEIVDVPAFNEYFGWYDAAAIVTFGPFDPHRVREVILENLPRIVIEIDVEKPLLISEWGAGAKAGLHAPEAELRTYTEEYQALVYRRQIAMLRRQRGVAGMSPWVLQDFRSPNRLYQGVQDHWNRKGLVSDSGEKKQAFFVLSDFYRSLASDGP